MYNDFLNVKVSDLEHSGVKGMKWGVRKAYESVKRSVGLGPKHPDKDEAEKIQKSKLVKEMSNDELRKVTQRLQLEQAYKAAVANAQPQGRKMWLTAYKKYAQESTDAFVKTAMTEGTRMVTQAIMAEILKKRGG